MITPILIVDHGATALLASRVLLRDPAVCARYGIDGVARTVEIVTSAGALWAWLAGQPAQAVAAVLLDQQLPDALGSQLVAPLRAHAALARPARIIGWSSAADAARAMRAAGADDFVWKWDHPGMLIPALLG